MTIINSSFVSSHDQPEMAFYEDFPLPVIDLDPRGVFLSMNQAACRLFEGTREQLTGRAVWGFMTGDQVKQGREVYFLAVNLEGELPVIRRIFHDLKGGFHTCDCYRTRLHDANRQIVGLRYLFAEITELQMVADDCKHSLLWHESLLDSLSDAVVATDALGFISYVNPAAERLIGWKALELQGKSLEASLPLLDDATGDQAMLALDSALERREQAETVMMDSEGQQLRVEIHSAPIVDKETGSTAGVISVIRRLG